MRPRVKKKKADSMEERKWKYVDGGLLGPEVYSRTDVMTLPGGSLYRTFMRFGIERGQGMITTAIVFVPKAF